MSKPLPKIKTLDTQYRGKKEFDLILTHYFKSICIYYFDNEAFAN